MATPNDTGWQDVNPQGSAQPTQTQPQAQAQPAQPQAQPKLSANDTGWQEVTPQAYADKSDNAVQPSPKIGLDLGTVGAGLYGAASGIGGLVKGAFDLAGRETAYLAVGQNEDIIKEQAEESEALKHRVYEQFKKDWKAGDYQGAITGLTHLFSDAPRDPNHPLNQFIDQSFKNAKESKEMAMESAKKGDFAGVMQHSVGAGVGWILPIDQAMEKFRQDPSRDNLKEVIATAIPAFVPSLARGVGKAGKLVKGAADTAVKARTTPTTTTSPMGAEIPVRQETPLAKAVAARAPEKATEFAQKRTAPAVQQAIGGTVGEATGSEAATRLTPEDRFGLKGHAHDLIENQARPAFKRVDELSGNKLTEAQNKIDEGWASMNKTKIAEGNAEKAALYDDYRQVLKSEGLDIDEAEATYGRGKAVERMSKRLDTATGPSDVKGLTYEVKPEVLRNVIDKGIRDGSWKRMGLTDEHINELNSLGKTMSEQANIPKVSRTLSGLGKLAVAVSGLHYGMLPAIEAVTGMSAADYVGGKISNNIMQDALTNFDATKAMQDAIKTGDAQPVVSALAKDPSWVSKVKAQTKDLLIRFVRDESGTLGKPGTVFALHEIEELKKLGMSDNDIAQMQKTAQGPQPTPLSDQLKKKYGTTDDPHAAAFILPNGDMIPLHGIHDAMVMDAAKTIGQKLSVEAGTPGPRETIIQNENAIRTRTRMTKAGQEVVFSIPESVSQDQIDQMRRSVGKLGKHANVVVEYGKQGGEYRTIENATRGKLMTALQDMGAMKTEPETAVKIARSHNDNNGFTYNPQRGLVRNKPVFSVAGQYDSLAKTYDSPHITAAQVRDFMDDPTVKSVLEADPRNSIGGWVHKGESHLEISKLFDNREEAIAEGKRLNQVEIYDHAKREGIPTGGTGVAPTSAEPTTANLSSPGAEGAGSAEAISRETARRAQGLRVYDVDTRMAGSKAGWNPVFGVDTADRVAAPYHAIVQYDPKTGAVETLNAADNARPLPVMDRVKTILGGEQGTTLPAPVTKERPLSKAEASTTARPVGSSVKLMKSPLPVESAGEKPLTADIAASLNEFTTRKLPALKLNEATPEEMIARAKPLMEDEARYQLAQNNSGQTWYTEQMGEHDRIAQEMRPELKNPTKLSLFKMAEAILSSGQKPFRNFTSTMEAFDHYQNTGEFPPTNPETGSSWGPRGAVAYGNAFKTLNHLVTQLGEDGAVKWLMEDHPVSELTALKKEISGTPSSRVAGKATDMRKGVLVFGEKRGPFALNLHGIETEFTADMWVSRIWNRWMGTLEPDFETGELDSDAPRSQRERNLMKQSFEETANKLGLTTSSLQAVLWYYEQALYTAHGAAKGSWSFSDAARRAADEERSTREGSAVEPMTGSTSFNPEEMR